MSPNKKYVAVAERGVEGERALVEIYDVMMLKRRKVLQPANSELSSNEIVSMSFSADSKGVLTQGGAPDWSLAYWLWQRPKLVAVSKSPKPVGERPVGRAALSEHSLRIR